MRKHFGSNARGKAPQDQSTQKQRYVAKLGKQAVTFVFTDFKRIKPHYVEYWSFFGSLVDLGVESKVIWPNIPESMVLWPFRCQKQRYMAKIEKKSLAKNFK